MKCLDSARVLHAAVRSLGELPQPDEAAQAASEALTRLIREEIERTGGAIPFARFMELVLYAPGRGYYSGGSRKFGEAGDFTTAPELSPLFSRCLARQCLQILQQLGEGDLLEFGAGSGVMAAELLAELERLGRLPRHYYIAELSGELRQRQQETITKRLPHLVERVVWLDELPETFRGVILGNEVLDAMPAQRFLVTEGVARELGVAWHDGQFADALLAESAPAVASALKALLDEARLDDGYSSEISLAAQEWIATLAQLLDAGAILLIDYGFPRREYYHPQRKEGTLMCHYRHRSHPDPYAFVGLQDITAHVDFTAIAEAAAQHGLHVAGFANQASFLLSMGILEMMGEAQETREQMAYAGQVRRLLQPEEMGELFKVIALTRGFDEPLLGFGLRDERARL
ncbi:MAG TPA: SAM-dependent methyltransferase [Gammaproteobacteria bacterium]